MKKIKLSVLILTKNNEETLQRTLDSIKIKQSEIIIVDSNSKDNTLLIAKKHTIKIFNYSDTNLGKKRQFALSKAKGDWVLILDADEELTKKLLKEISKIINLVSKYDAYYIDFNNHLFGKRLKYGGENYSMLRLIKRNFAFIKPDFVHEKYLTTSKRIGKLKGKINHYSYRSIFQIYSKFTDYALKEAKQKVKNKEKTSFKKIFMYPVHMFWARFIKDKGYKDGFFRISLDLGFAYMEMLTYIALLFIKKK
ncbi:MAG: glycosyltransferase family 2 protein [bacterium]